MKFLDIEQNSDEWIKARLGKVTCSNFGCFMANEGSAFGEPAKRYALQVALEILTGKKAEFSFANEHTERGHEQEPVARMLYGDECFADVLNGGFFDCGDYGDSPDGLIGDCGVVEFKSVIAPVHYATLRRGSFDPAYRWQLIGHLDCTGRDWVDFASYCADFPADLQLIIHRLWSSDYRAEMARLVERRSQFLCLVRETVATIRPEFVRPAAMAADPRFAAWETSV